MTAMSRNRRQAILRQSAGYIELGELLVETDRPVPASAEKVLLRGLRILDELPEPTRSKPDAKLLEVAMDKALGAEGQGSGDLKRPEAAIRLLSGKPASYLHFGEVSANLGSIKQALADGKSVTFHADYNSDSQSFGMPGSGFLHASMITRIDGDTAFYRNPHDSSKEGTMPLSLLAGGAEVFIADV